MQFDNNNNNSDSGLHKEQYSNFKTITPNFFQNTPSTPVQPVGVTVCVISDAVCPWCFVAKRKLEESIKLFSDVIFTVEWVPFFLADPDSAALVSNNTTTTDPPEQPSIPMPDTVSGRLYVKYGKEKGQQMWQALQKAGQTVNINWSEYRIPVSTVLSHGLIKYARLYHKQNEAMDSVFRYYFEEARDISKIDVLVSIAKELNLDENEARKYLQNPDLIQIVKDEAEESKQRYKVCGVPTFIISREDRRNYKLRFSGAQPVEVFRAAFKRILDVQ